MTTITPDPTEVDPPETTEVEPDEPNTEPAPEVDDTEADDPNEGREAAKYRRRLRDTETERDGLRTQLEDAHRTLIEGIASTAGRLQKPAVLWASGVIVDALLDEHGNVDPERVLAACERAATEFGVSRAPRPNYVPGEGSNPTGRGGGDGMAAVIAGR